MTISYLLFISFQILVCVMNHSRVANVHVNVMLIFLQFLLCILKVKEPLNQLGACINFIVALFILWQLLDTSCRLSINDVITTLVTSLLPKVLVLQVKRVSYVWHLALVLATSPLIHVTEDLLLYLLLLLILCMARK